MLKPIITKHFNDRVSSRLPGVSAKAIAEAIVWCIEHNHKDLRFVGRNKYKDVVARLWQFDSPYSDKTYQIVACDDVPGELRLLTIYPLDVTP